MNLIAFFSHSGGVFMYSIERKSEIINLLETHKNVNVAELAKLFQTSKETIRRDLRELEHDGALIRTHGGAMPIDIKTNHINLQDEYPVSVRGIRHFQEKQAICKKASSFIQPEDTVFVDNSSTTTYLAHYVSPKIPVTFITNSIQFLLESTKLNNQNHMFICLGGIFKSSNLSIYGNMSLDNAKIYYPNKAFLSCSGISSNRMLTDSSIQELETKKLMMELSNEVFLLADHSKFEKDGQIFLNSFQNVDYIITDSQTDRSSCEYLKNYGISLITA